MSIEKLTQEDGSSMDMVKENIDKLKEIFPDVFTEGKVDFDALQATLGEYVETGEERYSFNWHGKAQARRIAQTPSTGTLRPCPEESVDWDNTQNLFIEGDNLEVLKLLQKSYHKKVKMIYIDPPYNTGKEFIYPDKFQENLDTYLKYTGQKDDEGHKFSSKNTEESGRYHTNWLNMMYPRLKLAKNILRDDGIICISISDVELSNLRLMLDEIFGSENFINIISVLAKVSAGASGGGEDKRLKKNIEYVVIYAQSILNTNTLAHLYKNTPLMTVIDEMRECGESWKYTSILLGADKREHIGDVKDGEGNPIKIYKRSNVRRTTIRKVCEQEGLSEEEAYATYLDKIFSDTNAQTSIRTRVIDYVGNLDNNEILEVEYVPRSGKDKRKLVTHSYISNTVRRVIWLSDVAELTNGRVEKKERLGTLWDHFDYNNVGKEGGVPYPDGKKPIKLIQQCLELQQSNDGVVLDFFAGSCSSAHAVFEQNIADGGKRSFIVVQLPEPISEKKEYQAVREFAANVGIREVVSDLGQERIRRAAEKIKGENPDYDGDLGVKVLKLDSSNIKPWDADFDNIQQSLEDSVSNIKSERSEEDVLYEILLKYGLDLTLPIETRMIEGKKVFSIGLGALVICLDSNITLDVVEGIGKLKAELEPEVMRVVFKDNGFKDDVVKTNAIQILKRYDIEDVKSL